MSYQSNSWDEVERGLVLRRRQWLGKAGCGLPLDAHRKLTALSPAELHKSQGAGGALSIRALSRPIAFHFFPIPRFLLVFRHLHALRHMRQKPRRSKHAAAVVHLRHACHRACPLISPVVRGGRTSFSGVGIGRTAPIPSPCCPALYLA